MRKIVGLLLAFSAVTFVSCSDEGDEPEAKTPVIVSFRASETTVAPGDNVVLSWEVNDSVSVTIDAEPGGNLVDRSALSSGNIESRVINGDTKFTLTANGQGGKTASASVMITTDVARVAIVEFNVAPNPAPRGSAVMVGWETLGATRVRVLLDGAEVYVAQPNEISEGRFTTAAITAPASTLTLVASNDADTAMDEVELVTIAPAVISQFTASPSAFTAAMADVTLTWTASDADSLRLLVNGVQEAAFAPDNLSGGTYLKTGISAFTEFTLIAVNLAGEVRATALSAPVQLEVEPNNSDAEANVLTTSGASGAIDPAGDVDWYQITVGDGGNVFAETSDGMGGCALDTILRFYDDEGVELGQNDNKGGGNGMGMGMGMGAGRCSRIDPRNDDFAADLLSGTYYLSVEGKNMETGPYAMIVVIGTPSCGNAVIEGDEACDDGNTMSGDGCDATCAVEISATISPPGGMADVTVSADSYSLVSIEITTAGQSVSAIARDTSGGCTIDSTLLFRNPNGVLVDLAQSDVEAGECAEFFFPRGDGTLDLDVGTYVLEVENNTLMPATFRVSVTIHNPVCGNSAIERSQNEQCDDGNTTAADGCDATCRFEPLGTVMGPPGMGTFMDAISMAAQYDLYEVTLTAPGYIAAETFSPTVGTCTSSLADTVIEIYAADLTTLLDSNDDAEPQYICSRIVPDGREDLLEAGTYYVIVRAFSESLVPVYHLTIQTSGTACGNNIIEPNESCDDGNTTAGDACSDTCQFEGMITSEMEPNDTLPTANLANVAVGQTALFTGAISTVGDLDIYAVDITGMDRGIRALTHTDPVDTNICVGADTMIMIRDSAGVILVMDDDDGAGVCSDVDPTFDLAASGLAAGRYYVIVQHYSNMDVIPLYYLTIGVE